jgi:hypothetical protein
MTTLDQNRENQRESFAKRNGWYIPCLHERYLVGNDKKSKS